MTRQATPDLLGELLPGNDPSLATMFGSRTMLDPAVIRIDGGTQMRDGLDDATVTEYAEVMREVRGWGSFPACVVFYDGAKYWMADGFHRYAAFGRAGLKVMGLLMPAEVRSGTRRDAVLHAVAANANHGLRRTNADKRRSVLALLEDEEWSQWSDREIARRCAVSNRFVSDMRAELSSVNGSQIDERRVIRNGTEYTMHTANVGSAPALASQEAMWLTADEVLVQLDQWSDQFEEPDQALARLHDEASEGAGNTLDDWTNWVTGKWSLSRLLQALAALRLLPDEDEVREPEGKPWEPPDTAKFVESEPQNSNGMAVHYSSDSPEWYTPTLIIERTERVLGAIDLDPCSNVGTANVPAARHYTWADDGLSQFWQGRVYMNPPYGREIGDWVDKLREAYETGNVSEAIALLPARTDTAWFHSLRTYPRCFVSGRLKFSEHGSAAPFPSMAVYLGKNLSRFVAEFGDIGDVFQIVEVR